MLTATYIAQVVIPYTKASGKQLAAAQQYRSQRRAQALGRRFGHEGEVGADEAKVAIARELYLNEEIVHPGIQYVKRMIRCK